MGPWSGFQVARNIFLIKNVLNGGIRAIYFRKKYVLSRAPCWLKLCYPGIPVFGNSEYLKNFVLQIFTTQLASMRNVTLRSVVNWTACQNIHLGFIIYYQKTLWIWMRLAQFLQCNWFGTAYCHFFFPKLFWSSVRKKNVLHIEKKNWNLRLKFENLPIFEITRTIYSNSESQYNFLNRMLF